ncbi:MAG: L-threonylcarbamoyladenylate synthase [Chloroflexota bacterium]
MYDHRIEHAARVLADGGIVAFPTDTVYGLGVDVFNANAVERLREVKGRQETAPFPVLLAGIEQLETVVQPVPPEADALTAKFWPGALTLVLPTSVALPQALLKDGAVGVRLPDDRICRRLIFKLGRPITGTSANVSGQPPAMSADEVKHALGNRVDYILDAGRAQGGTPSTVLSLRWEEARVLREGAIPADVVLEALKATRAAS